MKERFTFELRTTVTAWGHDEEEAREHALEFVEAGLSDVDGSNLHLVGVEPALSEGD